MADPAPAPTTPKEPDLAAAQYVISLTTERYHARLKAAQDAASPRPHLEMGSTATAKASFKDAAGGDVAITSTEWSATGDVTVEPVEGDPTSAKLTPIEPGPATVTVIASAETGSAQASTDLMVIDKIGAPVSGAIEITADAPETPPPEGQTQTPAA